ncbi:MAG: ParA family protein [Desulfomonilaceae bacterium]
MGKLISLLNFKGGVGKTTLAVNVAACLAKDHTKRVLLVDLDPQSNSSVWVMGPAKWAKRNKRENVSKTASAMFSGVVKQEAFLQPYDEQDGNWLPGFYLLPSSFHMILLEKAINDHCIKKKIDGKYKPGDEFLFLSENAKSLREWFDFVIVDCPPNLYYGTYNAIVQSDYILIPCVPDFLSTSGLKMMIYVVEKTVSQLVKDSRLTTTPVVLGVAVSRYKAGTNEHQGGIEKIQEIMSEFQGTHLNLVDGQTKVFADQPVREYMVHSEAVKDNLPLCLYADKTSAYTDIRSVTDAILSAIQERQP